MERRKRKSAALSSTSGHSGAGDADGGLGRGSGESKKRRAGPSSRKSTSKKEAVTTPAAALKVLTNPMLMSKVAGYLAPPDWNDIKTLRSTCKLWNHAMVPSLRKKIIRFDLSTKPGSLKKFTSVMRMSAEIPFGAFRLDCWSSSHKRQLSLQDKQFQDFFSTCGQYMTKLDLNLSNCINGLQEMISVPMPMLTYLKISPHGQLRGLPSKNGSRSYTETVITKKIEMPALKVLKFKTQNSGPAVVEYFKPIAADCINGATSLRHLAFSSGEDGDFGIFILSKLKNAACQNTLTELKMKFPNLATPSVQELNMLTGLKITQLEIHVGDSFMEEGPATARHNDAALALTMLSQFLGGQVEYLKHLKIKLSITDYEEPFILKQFKIPSSPLLETLSLNLTRSPNVKIQLEHGGLSGLKKLAYVENVETKDDDDDNVELDDEGGWGSWHGEGLRAALSSPTITELVFGDFDDENYCPLALAEFRRLTEAFPGIRKVTISLQGESLPHLWSGWPDLEEINLFFNQTTESSGPGVDGLLTGISETEIAKLRKRITRLSPRSKSPKTAPGISDLPNLQVFSMKYAENYKIVTQCVTDITGYLAFAAPGSKLRHIEIPTGVRISDKCKTAIREARGPEAKLEIGQWEPHQVPQGCYCCWQSRRHY